MRAPDSTARLARFIAACPTGPTVRGDERISFATPGFHLIALNAKTGVPVPGFGTNGIVDMMKDLDHRLQRRSERKNRQQFSGRHFQ